MSIAMMANYNFEVFGKILYLGDVVDSNHTMSFEIKRRITTDQNLTLQDSHNLHSK